MKIENPFESGHIKNYLLFYAGVVVIMVLFFIASTLFHELKQQEKREFVSKEKNPHATELKKEEPEYNTTSRFRLLDKAY